MAERKKGTVVIRSVKGRLRLVWSFCGKRYFFRWSCRIARQIGRASRYPQGVAELKAKQIQRDIANDLFDPTNGLVNYGNDSLSKLGEL